LDDLGGAAGAIAADGLHETVASRGHDYRVHVARMSLGDIRILCKSLVKLSTM
jgi:hypothetical protein